MTYEEFIKNYLYTDTAKHNFQTAIQAALDIASIILADQSARLPKEYKDIFPALAEIGVLPADFAHKLVGMARFRNVLVHLYLEVDLHRLYRYLQEGLDDLDLCPLRERMAANTRSGGLSLLTHPLSEHV